MPIGIALLRGVNVGGHRRVPMAELRAALTQAGFAGVRSYIASGNLLFEGADAAAAEARIEALIAERFGLAVDVIVRSATELAVLAAANPLPAAAVERPKALHLLLTKRALAPDAAATLQARARDGEIIAAGEGALWIDFAGGAAASRLTPAMIDRACGSPATARNWNTVQTLLAMAAG